MGDTQLERNHLIFIDDIKLLAKDQETLIEICTLVDDTLKRMGMKINQAKSASNIESDQVFGQQVDEIDGYKYLGILENSQNVVKNENKEILKQKILMRIEALCTTKLNARNLFRGINEFAISTINYYIGILNYEPEEFEQLARYLPSTT